MIAIGFSVRPRNILSRMIRWVTKSTCSHTWLLIRENQLFGNEFVLEATEVGVRLIPYSIFKARGNKVVSLIDIDHDIQRGLREMSKAMGARYDFTGLFGMLVVYLGRVFRKRWKNPVRGSDAMFCSEFVLRVMQAANYGPVSGMDPDSVSPDDLMQVLSGNPKK